MVLTIVGMWDIAVARYCEHKLEAHLNMSMFGESPDLRAANLGAQAKPKPGAGGYVRMCFMNSPRRNVHYLPQMRCALHLPGRVCIPGYTITYISICPKR